MRKDLVQIAKEALIIAGALGAIYCAINSKPIINYLKEKAYDMRYEVYMTVKGVTVYNSVR